MLHRVWSGKLWWTNVLPRHTRGGRSLANCVEQCSCQVRRHGDGLPTGEPLGQEPIRKEHKGGFQEPHGLHSEH